jgi:hypothetical protein
MGHTSVMTSSQNLEEIDILSYVILFLLLPFVLGPLVCFPSELSWNFGSYRQLVGLLRRMISPIVRQLPTQSDRNTEEKRTDIHAVSGFRTYDLTT